MSFFTVDSKCIQGPGEVFPANVMKAPNPAVAHSASLASGSEAILDSDTKASHPAADASQAGMDAAWPQPLQNLVAQVAQDLAEKEFEVDKGFDKVREPTTIHNHSWGPPKGPGNPYSSCRRLPEHLRSPAVVMDRFWFPEGVQQSLAQDAARHKSRDAVC